MTELRLALVSSVLFILAGILLIGGAAAAYSPTIAVLNNAESTSLTFLKQTSSTLSSAQASLSSAQTALQDASNAVAASRPALSNGAQLTGNIGGTLNSVGSTIAGVGKTLSGICILVYCPFASVGDPLISVGTPIEGAGQNLLGISTSISNVYQQTAALPADLSNVNTQLDSFKASLSQVQTSVDQTANTLPGQFNQARSLVLMVTAGLALLGIVLISAGGSTLMLRRSIIKSNKRIEELTVAMNRRVVSPVLPVGETPKQTAAPMVPSPAISQGMSGQSKFCTKCGKALGQGIQFCGNCGAPV